MTRDPQCLKLGSWGRKEAAEPDLHPLLMKLTMTIEICIPAVLQVGILASNFPFMLLLLIVHEMIKTSLLQCLK